jgi:hypothetical protein
MDSKVSLVRARQDFERQMLMRFPRQLPGMRLRQRVVSDAGQQRLAIESVGIDSSRATLLIDRRTCVPIALQYTNLRSGSIARVDLSGYRSFGSVRFPTVLTTSIGGLPYTEERVSAVELNAPDAEAYFAAVP